MVKLIAPLDCAQEVLAEGTAVSEKFEFVLDTTNDVAALQPFISVTVTAYIPDGTLERSSVAAPFDHTKR